VQHSVCALMKRIRHPSQAILLWIDAICINQSNVLERNAQVGLMGQIYRGAASVIIWVGEEDERTPVLDQLFDLLYAAVDGDVDAVEALPWRLSAHWTDLAYFLDRPWFTRTWVLQEVCLARQARVHCGSFSWSWERLQRIFGFVYNSQDPWAKLDATGVDRRLQQGVTGFMQRWAREDLGNRNLSLLRLLEASRGALATEAVDKVYGILNLAQDQLDIEVDYEKNAEYVFTDTAIRMLRRGQVELLSHASDGVWNNVRGIPSWVPDWTCYDRPAPLPTSSSVPDADLQAPSEALNTLMAQPQVDDTRGLLTIQAISIDTVHVTGVPWPGNRHIKSPFIPLLDIWEIASLGHTRIQDWHSIFWKLWQLPHERQYVATGENYTAAFMRTIVADTVALPLSCTSWEQLYPAFSQRLWRLRREGAPRVYSELIEEVDGLKQYHEAVKTLCYKRTLFVTEQGLMALGPFFALPFDRIFIIPGVSSPLVLRRTWRGRYRLIGQCYIHGLDVEHTTHTGRGRLKTIVLE